MANITERDIYTRILAAMPDDAEVVAFCEKKLASSGKSRAKTAERMDITRRVLAKNAFSEDTAMTARDFARKVNELHPEQNWNTRTASYYLSRMAKEGVVEKIAPEKGKSGNLYYLLED